MSRCAIVVPAFNEAGVAEALVRELLPCAPVILVDDGSTDRTAEVAESAGAVVVRHDANRGYGAAIESGFRRAAADGFTHVVTADGDRQHLPEQVERFVQLVTEEGWELVVGIRPERHRLLERACAFYARHALGLADPLCGLKGYDLRFYRAYGGFDLRRSVGTELAAYAIRHGARWTQLPIDLRPREHGNSRFYTDVRARMRILRSLWALVTTR